MFNYNNIYLSTCKYIEYKKRREVLEDKTKNSFILLQDNWNDFGYYTHFGLFYCDENYLIHEIGMINICSKDMNMEKVEEYSHTDENVNTYYCLNRTIKMNGNKLDEDYCSISSSVEYYKNLQKVLSSEEEIEEFLEKICDVTILTSEKIAEFEKLDIFKTSLLRYNEFGNLLLKLIKLKYKYSLAFNPYKFLISDEDIFKQISSDELLERDFLEICKENLSDFDISNLLVNYIKYCYKSEKKGEEDKKDYAKILNEIKLLQADKLQFVETIDELLNTSEDIYSIIVRIKELLYLKEEDLNIIELGHYTSIENLQYLLLDSNSEYKYKDHYENLRLTNARQLNDPMEGKILLEYVLGNESKREESFIQSYLYLSSTTTELDSLPMWKQYTENSDGISLVYHKKYLKEVLAMDNCNISRVCYLELKNNGEVDVFSDNFKCDEDATEMKELLSRLKSYKDENSKVSESTLALLNSVSYLFKKSEYAYENEYRIIADREKNLDNIFLVKNNNQNIPILYTYLENQIKYSGIKLGPKAIDIDYIGPYIKHCDDKISVSKSDIAFR